MKIPFVDLKTQYRNLKSEMDAAIQGILEESAFILGPRMEEFEKAFASFCQASHGVGLGSGTDALYLALKAMGVGPGDEVVTVSHTYIATAEAISMTGAHPVFVDIEKETMLMDVRQLENAITSKTRVILPVHLYGQLCDMRPILDLAARNGIQVLEDCAQAHGGELNGKRSPLGTTAAFSFYPGKNLGAYGDAGAVVTRDPRIYEYLLQQRDHGRTLGSKYEHQHLGFGFRMDTLQAKILSVKLPHLEGWTEKRRAHASHYNSRLKDRVTVPMEKEGRKHVFHVYAIRTHQRDALRQHLESRGISTNIHYPIPVHLQPAYEFLKIKKGSLPVTEETALHLLSLPMFPELTESQVDYICDQVLDFFK